MVKPKVPLDFAAIFQRLPAPYLVLDRDLNIVEVNQAYLEATGKSRDELIGVAIFSAFPGTAEDIFPIKESLQRAIDQGTSDAVPVLRYSIEINGKFEEKYWSCTNVPLLDEEGKTTYILQKIQDISELKRQAEDNLGTPVPIDPVSSEVFDRAEQVQALNQELLDETYYLRSLFMQAPSFMLVLRGPQFIVEIANWACVKLAGDRNLIGLPVLTALPELVEQEFSVLLEQVYKSGEAFVGRKMRALLQGPDGNLRELYLDFVYQPILGLKGEVNGIFIEGSDITEHVKAEERQAMLIRELHHRVRNTLATVQGVMNTTAKSSATVADFQEAFAGRIASLAKTHAVMTEELQQSVPFYNLLWQELNTYAEQNCNRIVLKGPNIHLPSQIAVPLGLAVHELTTNAAKFGALCITEGRVEVTWSLVEKADAPALFCEWREFNGPPVEAPKVSGFGSMLLKRVLSQQIRADVDVEYDPQGFRLKLVVPLEGGLKSTASPGV